MPSITTNYEYDSNMFSLEYISPLYITPNISRKKVNFLFYVKNISCLLSMGHVSIKSIYKSISRFLLLKLCPVLFRIHPNKTVHERTFFELKKAHIFTQPPFYMPFLIQPSYGVPVQFQQKPNLQNLLHYELGNIFTFRQIGNFPHNQFFDTLVKANRYNLYGIVSHLDQVCFGII